MTTSSGRLISTLLVLVAACHLGSALTGPYVLWGVPRLQHIHVGGLQRLDDGSLRDVYAEAERILVFVRNVTLGPLRASMFPAFGRLLLTQNWAYLPQRDLSSDPLEFSGNPEVSGENYIM